MGVRRKFWGKVAAVVLPLLVLAGIAVFAVGGYFENQAFALHWPHRRAAHYPIAAVYWSGDMGLRLGTGHEIVESLRSHGIPVLSVSSPALFRTPRDRAYVDRAVATSVAALLARSGAERIAVIGSSFGADVIGSGLGSIAPALRARIASVVLVVPETDIYFHANPTGLFYRGPAAADPAHTIPLLRGLPVTCIFGTGEDESLCRHPVMRGARRIGIDDGHAMLFSHALVVSAVDAAVLHPPAALR